MSIVDVILILIVGGFVFFGLFFGLVHTLGSLLGTVIGIVVASNMVGPMYERFGFLLGGGGAGKVAMFVIIFFLVARVFGLLMWILRVMFGWFAWVPLAGLIDRILGAAFGLIEGLVFVSVALILVYVDALYRQDETTQQVMLTLFQLYSMWVLVAIWRCAANAKPPWGVIARLVTIAWAANTVLVAGFLQIPGSGDTGDTGTEDHDFHDGWWCCPGGLI